MKSFKSFSIPIIEGTVSIWSGALRRKPQAYADGFIDKWKNGKKMTLINDKGYVELKKDLLDSGQDIPTSQVNTEDWKF